MSKINPLSLAVAGLLLVAAACLTIPTTHALGWSLLGVPMAVADAGDSDRE